MKSIKTSQEIIKKLYSDYQLVGYVTEDNVLKAVSENDIPLDEVDYVCDQLLSLGVIIRDNTIEQSDNEEDVYDRSKIDYEKLYNEVITIDPNLEIFIGELRQIKPPQNRECNNLILQAKNNNIFAKERIIEMYLRVVVKIAMRYHKKYKIPLADAIQDGCVGLVIAIDKYDVSRQDKFSTYAPWWIIQMLNRVSPIGNPLLYFPVHVKDKLIRMYEIVKQHHCDKCGGRDVCIKLLKLISIKLECKQEEAKEYVKFMIKFESIEELLQIDEGVFTDKGVLAEKVFYQYNNKESKKKISEVLDSLSEREKQVVEMRFGFFNYKVYTLEEVGKLFGLTRERIRQIEKKALNRLRHPSRSNKLRGFL